MANLSNVFTHYQAPSPEARQDIRHSRLLLLYLYEMIYPFIEYGVEMQIQWLNT